MCEEAKALRQRRNQMSQLVGTELTTTAGKPALSQSTKKKNLATCFSTIAQVVFIFSISDKLKMLSYNRIKEEWISNLQKIENIET